MATPSFAVQVSANHAAAEVVTTQPPQASAAAKHWKRPSMAKGRSGVFPKVEADHLRLSTLPAKAGVCGVRVGGPDELHFG